MNRGRQLTSFTALAVGLAAGGYLVAAAESSGSASREASEIDFGTSFANLNAEAQQAVSNDEIDVEVWRDGDVICIRARWFAQGSIDEACDSLAHIATGTTYIQHSPTLESERLVLGVVPDGVDAVRVGDEMVPVTTNVWYSITNTSPGEFTVATSDGTASVSTPIASPAAPANTIFVEPG